MSLINLRNSQCEFDNLSVINLPKRTSKRTSSRSSAQNLKNSLSSAHVITSHSAEDNISTELSAEFTRAEHWCPRLSISSALRLKLQMPRNHDNIPVSITLTRSFVRSLFIENFALRICAISRLHVVMWQIRFLSSSKKIRSNRMVKIVRPFW